MSLEGNLRDLALPEVCQLLAHTRKSGDLCIDAPLAGLHATLTFDKGSIVAASLAGTQYSENSAKMSGRVERARLVESIALELITWREGKFRFVPIAANELPEPSGVRINTEIILMEGARRIEEWSRLSDRIPHSRVVPAFVDVEPRQLPLLNLLPQQWEVLTCVDGQRDLPALARALSRDVLDLAEIVHGLLGTGLLCLVDSARGARTHATPPSSSAPQEPSQEIDLWVPATNDARSEYAFEDDGDDEIFDPVLVGVITPDGLPRLRTPLESPLVPVDAHRPADGHLQPNGHLPADSHRLLGDAAARNGDLLAALSHWNAVLEANARGADAAHAREAISLASRLLTLVNMDQPA